MLYTSSHTWGVCLLLVSLALSPASSQFHPVQPDANAGPDDPGLSRYVSRPDLAAPIWDVKIYHEDLVSPGYWFVAPYKALNQAGSDRSWVGPHIYDGKTGELVWSGSLSYYFSKGNVEDFRISNVNGEYLMTLMAQRKGQGVLLDSSYQIVYALQVDPSGAINTHEFNFVENGTRALIMKTERTEATKEMSKAIGYNGQCTCAFDGFEEYDTTTWQTTFQFKSFGKIGLDESTLTENSVEKRCKDGWDYIHSNSVDKTPDGDYIWSARHTDTLYKISKDGDVIWRLGGKNSDFEHVGEDMVFSRQHNIRYRSRNDTHMLVSILDNAKGIDKQAPTWNCSRGLLIAIDEKNMKASIEKAFDHPDGVGGYAPRRGNYQVLDNGNIFMGWSEFAQQSEHTPDGKLIMEAVFKVDWLGTYRGYKFPFVGHPTEPPVAHSQAYGTPNNSTTTTVHVSWNGATEITAWNLYRTVRTGQVNVLVATAEKLGFETVLSYGGYASYIIAEAIDKNGTVLGRTDVMKTFAHSNVTAEAVAEEDIWLKDFDHAKADLLWHATGILGNPITAFFMGCIFSAVVLVVGWQMRQRNVIRRYLNKRRGIRYDPLPGNSGYEQEVPLRSSSRRKEHDPDDMR